MLRRLGIRAKVMAVLAVPMLVLFGAGAYISVDALREAKQVRAAEGVMAALQAYAPLSGAIEAERMLSLNGGTPEQINAARIASDDALRDVFPLTRALDLDAFPANVVSQFKDVQFAHNEMLPSARHLVDINGHREEIARYYNTIITGQIALMESVANALPNRDLARYVTAYREVATTSDGLVSELIDAIALIKTRVSLQTAALAYANETAANELSRHRARDAVEGLGIAGLELNPDDPSYNFTNIRSDLSQGNANAFQSVDMQAYAKDIQDQLLSLSSVNDKILETAHGIATKAADDAQNRAFLTIGLAIAAGVASLFFAVVIARGIVTPLRRLTAAAANVREQLPKLVEQVAVPGEGPEITLEPIPVTTRDEVGELAQAFNSVNATTVQVAQEQAALRGSIAEMFVNVARRDQVLLNRQLSFIDSLERAEEDPSTLANLFRLDHLATRMRRNAESLLVLAGIDSGRRLRDAMPLSDVIRTASSEIEQYDRVELDLQVDPAMLGFNALGAAHMLAELLENATVFSEPETPVIVTTGVVGQFVVVRVLDQGLGMSDQELETANARIKSTGASDALGAQRLGLFVVGRLAQRLGADVYLGKSPRGTGTETIVRFPASLFAANEQSLYGTPMPAASSAPSIAADAFTPPVVEEVNLAALTDGSTALGLPRRRRGDDAGETDTNADGIPGVAPVLGRSELPARPSKTFDLDKIVLPEAPSGNISADLTTESTEWKPPTIAAEPLKSAGGLPSRTRAATAAWATPAEETPAASAPAPAARAGLFSGFRGRGDLVPGTPAAGTPIPGLAPEDDRPASAPDAVRAPWMSLGAHAATPEPIVVPSLVEDDEPAWQPEQPTDVVEETPAVAEQAPAETEADADAWAPAQAAETTEPWAPTPAADVDEAWAPTPAAEVAEAWAPQAAETTEPWAPTPAAEVDEPAWTPTAPEQHEVATAAAAVADEPWAPVEDWAAPAQPEEPAWAPQAAAEPADEPWAPQAAEPVDEPAVAELPSRVSPLDDSPMFDTVLHEAAAEQVAEPVVEPAAEVAPVLPTRRSVAADAPVADAPAAFTSYSGYSGWAGAAARAAQAQQSAAPQAPFERTLDEARAWHTGAMPIVPEAPAATADVQEPAGDAWPTPAWEAPAWQPPTWQAPADEAVEATNARTDETATIAPVIPELEPETWDAPVAEAWPTLEPDPQPVAEVVEEHAPVEAPYAPAPYAQAPEQYAPAPEPYAPAGFAQAPAPFAPAPAPFAPPPAPYAQAPAPFAQAPAPAPFAPATAPAPAPFAQAPAPAPVVPAAPAPVQQPWAAAPAPEQAFSELVQGDDESRPKRRWGGLFGKRKGDDTASAGTPSVAQAAAEPVSPPRTSAWSAEQPAPVAEQSAPSWSAPSWSAPAAPVASTPAPVPAAPAPLEQRSAGSWSPPEWAARPPAAGAPVSTVPHPNVPPSVAPRIGTLDDEVAAMLALRSDIQEQALSELSQLSAYRPSAVGGSGEQLTRRVPSAVPTTPAQADEGKPVQRDADELRSRLSSFQSGTSRGRRASGDASTQQNGPA
ncbi:ATP-binding protein [Cellulomonas sp.]|uniref:ATP-binding protein n=1 Tax=Cellulomonas sp. TaxID=40001 RepID=UPI001B0CEC15|nr:ATP-binding protein [Cellulomonas sp.]MBO9553531.1 HAMP domain-containing protein [Cellulomonas sp.]